MKIGKWTCASVLAGTGEWKNRSVICISICICFVFLVVFVFVFLFLFVKVLDRWGWEWEGQDAPFPIQDFASPPLFLVASPCRWRSFVCCILYFLYFVFCIFVCNLYFHPLTFWYFENIRKLTRKGKLASDDMNVLTLAPMLPLIITVDQIVFGGGGASYCRGTLLA